MVVAQARLSVRLAWFELLAFCGLTVGLAILGTVVAANVAAAAPPAVCYGPELTDQLSSAACDAARARFQETQGPVWPISALLVFLPFAAGVFLGVPIVGRELERGTARLAWSLTTSRWRWYLLRMLPILAVLAVTAIGAGFALDRLTAATRPELDVGNAFDGYGFRGVLIASRALFILGLAVLVGAVLGRALPGIIVASVIAVVGLTGGQTVHERILRSEAIVFDDDAYQPGALYVDTGWRLPDGAVVRYWELPDDPYDAEGNPRYPQVQFLVPGDRYQAAVVREAVVLGAATLGTLALAGYVVTRRRPT